MTDWFTPAWVVGLEAALPILLLLQAPLGLLLTALLVFEFGSIGAPAFAAVVITMAAAFLTQSEWVAARDGLRRGWPLLALLVAGAWGFGLAVYDGPYPKTITGLFHAYAIVMAVGAALTQRTRTRGSLMPAAPGERATGSARAFLLLFAALSVFNGMTPYLGLKFQFSFAMLSNLRVDDDRWNSLVFPRGMRLTEFDPYVHVTRVRYLKLATGERFDGGGILEPALYSPTLIRMRLQRAFEKGVQVTFDFHYRGQEHRFVGQGEPEALYRMIELMPDSQLWQKELVQGAPQDCVH